MANIKIRELPLMEDNEITDIDVLAVDDVETGVTKKILWSTVRSKVQSWIDFTLQSFYNKTEIDTKEDALKDLIQTNLFNSGIPAGSIVAFSGTISSIPEGWALCDGSNGTPDLRGKFIKGASTDFESGSTSGSINTSTIATGVPEHTHDVTISASGAHSHTITPGGNYVELNSSTTGGNSYGGFYGGQSLVGATNTGISGSHTHTISISTEGSGDGSHSHTIDPVHYKLLYIIKVDSTSTIPSEDNFFYSSSEIAPAPLVIGHIWYDEINNIMKVWNGSSWDNMAATYANANTLDNLDSTQFLRSDVSDTFTDLNGSSVTLTSHISTTHVNAGGTVNAGNVRSSGNIESVNGIFIGDGSGLSNVTGIDPFVINSISSSQYNNLMIEIAGELYTTSGNNSLYGDYGTGRGTSGANPILGLEGLRKVTFPGLPLGVSMVDYGGNGHSGNYALFDNNWLYTWGRNTYGECGNGTTSVVPIPYLAMTNCVKVWSAGFDGFAVDHTNIIVQKTDGKVYGAGENDNGELGLGNTTQSITTFTEMTWCGTNPKFVKGSNAYGGMTLCQKSDSSVWTCGYQHSGSLFNNVASASGLSTPVNVSNNIGGAGGIIDGDVIDFKHAHSHHTGSTHYIHPSSFVLIKRHLLGGYYNYVLYGAGNNTWGQMGTGNTTTQTTPVKVFELPDTIFKDFDIIGGDVVTIRYLTKQGNLYVLGHNGQGQCGDGTTTSVLNWKLVASNVDELMAKGLTSHLHGWRVQNFIRKTDGHIYGCGENTSYYLGLGDTVNKSTFQKIEIPENEGTVKFIGTYTTETLGRAIFAITDKNSVYAWGYNGGNGISRNTTRSFRYPTKMYINTRNV